MNNCYDLLKLAIICYKLVQPLIKTTPLSPYLLNAIVQEATAINRNLHLSLRSSLHASWAQKGKMII